MVKAFEGMEPSEADLAEIEAEEALVDLAADLLEPTEKTGTLVPTDDEYVTWDEDDYRE